MASRARHRSTLLVDHCQEQIGPPGNERDSIAGSDHRDGSLRGPPAASREVSDIAVEPDPIVLGALKDRTRRSTRLRIAKASSATAIVSGRVVGLSGRPYLPAERRRTVF